MSGEEKNIPIEENTVQEAVSDKKEKSKKLFAFKAPKTNEPFSLKKEILDWALTILIAVVIAFAIKTFLFDMVRVDGLSMYPTLNNNDRIIVTKMGYRPQRQDIIVLDSHYDVRQEYYNSTGANMLQKAFGYFNLDDGLKKRYYVKRVIGLAGDKISLNENNKVCVNGEPLDESSYYDGETFLPQYNAVTFPFTVSEGHVFVMGDNRNHSTDSRTAELGEVPVEAIMGKCSLRILPLSSFGILKH